MSRIQSIIAVACVFLLLAPAAPAQDNNSSANASQLDRQTAEQRAHRANFEKGHGFSRLTQPYKAREVPPVNLANSNRLDSLLRAGRLYLSLQDAIALALENNLDIEIQRYGPQIAEANLMRAKAGGALRGVSTTVTTGPESAQTFSTTGITGTAAQQAAAAQPSTSQILIQTGTVIPNLDPLLLGSLNFGHQSTPQPSGFVLGTNAYLQDMRSSSFTLRQGFLTGTTVDLGISNFRALTNNRNADFNPSSQGSLTLNITQHLLQGFGRAVNARLITVARNQREISDLVFKQQVISIVSSVMNLYWDLVSFNEDVRVKKQVLAASEKLYNDNKKQVEIGTLAPIEIVRAEAEVATGQQNLTISETRVLQQETILKNALSRNGVASPAVADARIVPTDRIQMPETEAIQPIQDLVATALSARPELAQNRISLENARIQLRGSKSALLPSLDGFVRLGNNGLAGQVNPLPLPAFRLTPGQPPPERSVNPFFIGGYGSVLEQIFSRNFPDYSAGFNLNIPIRNRAAQADFINDELAIRQSELQLQRLQNQIRVDVQNALIGVQQARASYQAAVKARVLQEQTLDAEQKKYALGASTIFNVILVQRDLATAQANEVSALSAYSKAKVELDRATGLTLEHNNISIDEAFRGTVSRQSTPPPPSSEHP